MSALDTHGASGKASRMRTGLLAVLLLLGCAPVAPAQVAAPVATTAVIESPRPDACRRDIPDCEAACALRETNRTDYIEWFDRRCAAVVLGKNPDKVVGQLPSDTREAVAAAVAPSPSAAPQASASASAVPAPIPTTRQLAPTPFDPFAGRNTPAAEPPECAAARVMRSNNRAREADVLSALCSARGGSERNEPHEVDVGF